MSSVLNPTQYQQGFTLIELLIVIAIILILIAIALPNFLEAQIRAKVTKAATDTRALATGMESYFIDRNSYTNNCPGPDIPGCIVYSGGPSDREPGNPTVTFPVSGAGFHGLPAHQLTGPRSLVV